MKKLFLIVFLGGLCAVVTTVQARQQALQNGSYETADAGLPTSWLAFGGALQSSVVAEHRQFSAQTDFDESAFTGMYQDPPAAQSAIDGDRILMKAKAYIDPNAVFGGQTVAGIKLEFFPPGGIEVPPPTENLSFTPASPLDQWVQVSVSEVVPPGITIAKLVILSFDTDVDGSPIINGPMFVDDAYAEVSSAPGVNILENPTFADAIGGSGSNGLAPQWIEFADFNSFARKFCFGGIPWLTPNCGVRIGGQTTAGLFQQVPVTPGQTITFRANFRWNSLSNPPPSADPDILAGVKIEWIAGNVPSPQIDVVPNGNPISGTTNIVNSGTPRGQWVPVSIDYTMPVDSAAALRATIINAFGAGASNCNIYFDSFEMVFTNRFDGSDSDGDDDEDMVDIFRLQHTFTGAGGGMVFGGLVFDHDDDNDVDAPNADFTLDRMTGPAAP